METYDADHVLMSTSRSMLKTNRHALQCNDDSQLILAAPNFVHEGADCTPLYCWGETPLRVVGSSVANSLSSANTEASVTLLRSVLLPALV